LKEKRKRWKKTEKAGRPGREILSCLFLVLLLLGGCGERQVVLTTGFGRDEILRVEELGCRQNELLVYIRNLRGRYEEAFGSGIWEAAAEDVSLEKSLRQTAMARLAKIKLMNLMAGAYQVRLNSSEKKQAAAAAAEYYGSLSEAEKEALGQISESALERMYEEYALAQRLYEKLTQDVDTEVSDDEARIITLHRIVLYAVREGEDGSVIRTSAEERKALAESLRGRIEGGEDFDTLAYDHSQEEEIGMSLAKGEADPAIEECCFSLAEGELSPVIDTEEGTYLFLCISTCDREQTEQRKIILGKQRRRDAFEERYQEYIRDRDYYLNSELLEQTGDGGAMIPAKANFFTVYDSYFNPGQSGNDTDAF
jgi:foldase protein PrsA